MSLEIKELKWRNNTTQFGKKGGLFDIVSDIEPLDLSYSITNEKDTGKNFGKYTDKFYAKFSKKTYTFDTLAEAKAKCQTDFEKKITKLFLKELVNNKKTCHICNPPI